MAESDGGSPTASRRNRRAFYSAPTIRTKPTVADQTPPLGVLANSALRTDTTIADQFAPPPSATNDLTSPILVGLGWVIVIGSLSWVCILLLTILGSTAQLVPLLMPFARLLLALLIVTFISGLVLGEGGFGERSVLLAGGIAVALLVLPQWTDRNVQLILLLFVLGFVGLFLGYQLLPPRLREKTEHLVDELLCATNNHSWTPWSAPNATCQSSRHCPSCTRTETRIVHQHSQPRYLHEGSCQQSCVCERCGQVTDQVQLIHSWGNPQYEHATSCAQVRVCQRCSEVQALNKVDHPWDVWQYASPTSCQQIRHCRRCHASESKLIQHLWGKAEYQSSSSCQQVLICQRCREEKLEGTPVHKWGNWDYESPVDCRLVRHCLRCHEAQLGKIAHKYGEWQPDSARGVERRLCPHCNKTEEKPLKV